MADYIEITESETNPEAPITSELLKKTRDNPIAIAEGADGAPKVQASALGNRTSYSTTTGVSYITVTDLDLFRTFRVEGYVNIGSADAALSIQVQLSDDNGVSWTSLSNLLSLSNSGLGSGSLRPFAFVADLVEGVIIPLQMDTALSANTVALDFGAATYNAIRWRSSNGVTLLASLHKAEDCKPV